MVWMCCPSVDIMVCMKYFLFQLVDPFFRYNDPWHRIKVQNDLEVLCYLFSVVSGAFVISHTVKCLPVWRQHCHIPYCQMCTCLKTTWSYPILSNVYLFEDNMVISNTVKCLPVWRQHCHIPYCQMVTCLKTTWSYPILSNVYLFEDNMVISHTVKCLPVW
jgi:hypothetical protein